MADKILRIKLIVDETQAVAASGRANKSLGETEQVAKRSTAAMQKGAERAAIAIQKLADLRAAIEMKAADRSVAGAQKLADAQAIINMKAADRQVQITERAEERKAIAGERTIERQTKADEKEITRKERMKTKLYTQEEAHQRALTEVIRRKNDKMIEAELKAMGITDRRFKNGWEGANMLADGVKFVTSQFAAMAGAEAIVSSISRLFSDASRNAMEAGKFVTSYREDLLELAALKDRLGNTTPELRDNLMFRAATLQSRDQATAFQKAALGVGQSTIDDTKTGRQGLIAPDEFTKLMKLGGSFQATEGGSAETHGALTGQLPMLMGKRTTADEAFAMEQKLYSIFQPGGADFTPLTQGFLKNAPLATSGLISPERLAALESGMSVTDREGHAEKTQQFVRATVGGIGRMKGVKVEGDSEKIGQYLKRIGATDKQDPIEIGKKISADLSAQEKAGVNPMTYLQSRGYGNMEDRQSLLTFHGLNKTGQFKTFEDLAAAPANPADARKKIDQFQATDPVALEKKKKISDDLANTVVGGGANEYYGQMTKLAYNKLKAKGSISGEYDEIMNGDWKDLIGSGRRSLVEREVTMMQESEAARVGMPEKIKSGPNQIGRRFPATPMTYSGRAQQAYENAQGISKAGGNIMPGFDQLVGVAEKQLQAMQGIQDQLRSNAAKIPPAQPLPINAAPAKMGRVN